MLNPWETSGGVRKVPKITGKRPAEYGDVSPLDKLIVELLDLIGKVQIHEKIDF